MHLANFMLHQDSSKDQNISSLSAMGAGQPIFHGDSLIPDYDYTAGFEANQVEFDPTTLSLPGYPFISIDPRDFDWNQLAFTGMDGKNYFQAP